MDRFTVTFDEGRVGRHHDVAPLTFTVKGADGTDQDLADAVAAVIYRHARPHLVSREFDVLLDLETGRGGIYCGFNNGGTFTVTREPAVQR